MSVAPSDPQNVVPLPPEPHLTPAEAIARAKAIASTLVERQAETEQRTFYAQDTHEEFTKAGFYRLMVPRRYGGYEFGPDTFLRVAAEIARGCPSTGWMYLFGAAHALPVASLFGAQAQAELFADGDFICPATVAPAGSAERVEGGWRISGVWSYSSGVPYSTHYLGHTLIAPQNEGEPPAPLMFILPRSDYKRLDDWGTQLGLRGSGSHSVQIDNAFVPDHFTLHDHLSQLSVTGGTPGRVLHRNTMYGGGPLSFMLLELGALAVGISYGALDAYEELMTSRMTIYPPIVPRTEDPDYQLRYGEATGKLSTASAALYGAVQEWIELSAQGPEAFTREQEWRLSTVSREVVRLCWDAVANQIFPTAGSSAIRRGARIERVWRDLSMLHSHAGYAIALRTMANRELTKAHFGID
jgi:3-hydroxy-9,10-secoandrosta-1,3,5(10)-triene-9,17-dione monooxygenase